MCIQHSNALSQTKWLKLLLCERGMFCSQASHFFHCCFDPCISTHAQMPHVIHYIVCKCIWTNLNGRIDCTIELKFEMSSYLLDKPLKLYGLETFQANILSPLYWKISKLNNIDRMVSNWYHLSMYIAVICSDLKVSMQ